MPQNLISIQDFSKEEILHILSVAREFEAAREQDFLRGKVVACLFFEPSTRTRLSFEAAVSRLGAQVIGFPDNRNTSQSKGETLEDTIRKAGGKLLESIALFDVYTGAQIAEGSKSVAFSLSLRAADRTLTDAECDAVMQKILKALADDGATLRM